MLDAYFRQQTRQIADACLADIKDRADWERKRPELRRQFLEMMGLWPLPPRTDLKPVITGTLDADRFTVEKLHFQSSPGLYVSGNLYVPRADGGRKSPEKLPAVLYVCGHGAAIDPKTKVSYGNKVTYQHHAVWFAEHGYVCLVIDTLQLGELQGLHHGTHHLKMWWWQTLGYTPAGIECWNAIRALDYLETRPEVDPKRIGVTGRSGGGATSWWLAAADDRPQCIIPVAGIADLQAHLVEGVAERFRKGVISGHCDCIYFVNTYRWDFPLVAALCAPRPLLLGNSDADDIVPVPGYRRLADKVRRIYDLYGAGDRFALLETAGPHRDTVELRLGAYRWMDRWLKGESGQQAVEVERPRFPREQLKVFDRPPEDAVNAIVHETFLKPARPTLPQVPAVVKEWWPGQSQLWLQTLREKVFRGWPTQTPPLGARLAADVRHHGLRLRAFDFTSEEAIDLRLWLLTGEPIVQPEFLATLGGSPGEGLGSLPWAALHLSNRKGWVPRDKDSKPSLVVLNALDEADWQELLAELGPAFQDALQGKAAKFAPARFRQTQRVLQLQPWAFAYLAPRGIGPTRWAEPGTPAETHLRRRFALLGQTLDGQRVWDVRRGLAVLRGIPELKDVPLWLQGKGDLAGVALYASLFEPDVARLDLWQLPPSHLHGPTFLNVRRTLDTPQALALAFPKAIRLYVRNEAEARAWEWPLQLQQALGQKYLQIRVVDH
jgi:hypothetical protein